MKNLTLLLSFWLIFTGCNTPHYADFFPYHDDGSCKPKVALLEFTTDCNENAHVADYLDQSVRWMAMDHGKLFIYTPEEISVVVKRNADIIAGHDPIKIGNCFHPADFVVEVDLIQNDLEPFSIEKHPHFKPLISLNRMVHTVKARLRICDLRWDTPKVCLYEVFERSQLLPTHNEHFYNTPGIYALLAEQLICRIEEVIGD